MKEIKNIVFDLGGVIVDLDIRTCIMAFDQLGIKPKDITLEELSRTGIPKDWEMVHLMHAMDVGEMDTREFIDIMLASTTPGTTEQQIADAFNSIIRLPRQRLEWLQELKQHYRLFLLSNLSPLHWEETQQQAARLGIPIESCFHQTFLSYQLRMVKPDPRIFQHLIATTGVVPEETLYIDDLPANIAAGKAAGLVAHKIDCNMLDAEMPKLFPEIINK